MAAINSRRVALGAVAGGVVWTVWSLLVNTVFLGQRYAAAQEAGLLLKEPRYPYFIGVWIVGLFLVSWGLACLYAWTRATKGAGPGTAVMVGLIVGFAAGFPGNLATASWSPVDRAFPLWWMLDLWVGAILATLVAGWLYRE
jgi:hypothetical protein